MSNHQQQQGYNDARQGSGPKNTHGMHHHAANAYNTRYKDGKK